MGNCERRGASHRKNYGDTSPPIWELRSAGERQNVYERQPVLAEHFCFCEGFARMRVFTFVNDQVPLGALGVNTLNRKRFE